VVIAYPEGVWYKDITPKLAKALVRKHLQGERLEDNVVYVYEDKFIAVNERGTKGKKKK
jgi:(2Fe-2S) ferredoxin